MKGWIVLAGSVAQKPYQGGHTWVFLQYLLGFRRLGWDVLFLDRLEPDMAVDDCGAPCPLETSANLAYLQRVMDAASLGDAYAVACDQGARFVGLPRREVIARVSDAAAVINVMGFFTDDEILGRARRRVFLDIDPGFGQMWRQRGWHDPYAGYDHYVTVGENVGRPDCGVPDCGLRWITTCQPVVLEHWPASAGPRGGPLTSIGAWRGPYEPIDYEGRTYGLRVHEFRKFATLPRRSAEAFEVALDIHEQETRDLSLLAQNGWRLVDPRLVARSPAAYRAYVRGSKAEFMVAKNMYVQTRSGWFSDRSICYLASGRPVLVQDTGLAELYPVGEGLLTFSTLDEALAGVEDIDAHYERHARRAREIAEACFDSTRVLTRLLDLLGIA